MVNNMSVFDLKAKCEASEKVSTMRDIFETPHIRLRVVYVGHRLRTKSTSWVLVSSAHEFWILSPCYFDVEGRNSSSNFTFSLVSYPFHIDECNDDSHVCDSNANCTNTNGSYNCICKEGYIINGQSCQCRLEQRYLMSSEAAFHNKYCLRNWGYNREVAWWFSRPDLVFLLSYGFHHMHTFTFVDVLEYNTHGYFTSCLVFFRERKETG